MTQIKIEAHGYSFYIEKNWLTESGIKPFSRAGGHYKYFKKDSRDVIIVRISEIDPSIRGDGIPIFKDGETEGQIGQIKSRDERVLDILRALKNDIPLPTVEVVKLSQGDYRFKLYNGCHRLHLSILVGFDSIPAVMASNL